jgi:hypothetical protein
MNADKLLDFVADQAETWKPSVRRVIPVTDHLTAVVDAVDSKDKDQMKHHAVMAVDLMEMDTVFSGAIPEPVESQSAVARLSRAVDGPAGAV